MFYVHVFKFFLKWGRGIQESSPSLMEKKVTISIIILKKLIETYL